MPKKIPSTTPLFPAAAGPGHKLTLIQRQQELATLVNDLRNVLLSGTLQSQAKALAAIRKKLLELGATVVATAERGPGTHTARANMLYYLTMYPRTVHSTKELGAISGIDEYPKRLRELKTELGTSLFSGITAKVKAEAEMKAASKGKGVRAGGALILDGIDVTSMKKDDYILLSEIQDAEAAARWKATSQIRNSDDVAADRMLQLLRHPMNISKVVKNEVLQKVAGNQPQFARRLRALRSEGAWPIIYNHKEAGYILQEDKQGQVHDRNIPRAVYAKVLKRDKDECQKCGWSHKTSTPSDPQLRLELHHIEHHKAGGPNTAENLITLCDICHDVLHTFKPELTAPQLFTWIADKS